MQFNIRNMPDALHLKLKIYAATQQTTMEQTALNAISIHLDNQTAAAGTHTAQEDTHP